MMDTKEMIIKLLDGWGYIPRPVDNDKVLFCYQQTIFCVIVGGDAIPNVSVLYPCVTQVEKGTLKEHLVVCNKLNRDCKAVKVYFDREYSSITACVEFISTDLECLRANLMRAIEYLEPVRVAYQMLYSELSNS